MFSVWFVLLGEGKISVEVFVQSHHPHSLRRTGLCVCPRPENMPDKPMNSTLRTMFSTDAQWSDWFSDQLLIVILHTYVSTKLIEMMYDQRVIKECKHTVNWEKHVLKVEKLYFFPIYLSFRFGNGCVRVFNDPHNLLKMWYAYITVMGQLHVKTWSGNQQLKQSNLQNQ